MALMKIKEEAEMSEEKSQTAPIYTIFLENGESLACAQNVLACSDYFISLFDEAKSKSIILAKDPYISQLKSTENTVGLQDLYSMLEIIADNENPEQGLMKFLGDERSNAFIISVLHVAKNYGIPALEDAVLRLLNIKKNLQLSSLFCKYEQPTTLLADNFEKTAWSSDEKQFAYAGSFKFSVWDILKHDYATNSYHDNGKHDLQSICWSPDNTTLAICMIHAHLGAPLIKLWRPTKPLLKLQHDYSFFLFCKNFYVAWTTDSRHLAVIEFHESSLEKIMLWDTHYGSIVYKAEKYGFTYTTQGNTLHIFDTESTPLYSLQIQDDQHHFFSPSGSYFYHYDRPNLLLQKAETSKKVLAEMYHEETNALFEESPQEDPPVRTTPCLSRKGCVIS